MCFGYSCLHLDSQQCHYYIIFHYEDIGHVHVCVVSHLEDMCSLSRLTVTKYFYCSQLNREFSKH